MSGLKTTGIVSGVTALLVACAGSTGSGLVSFAASAAGPSDTASLLRFDTSGGFHVTLTTATIHMGAVYLTSSAARNSSESSSCIEPGRHVAQVTEGVDVDLLSSQPTPFPTAGIGTVDEALTGEIWLTGGDVDANVDPTTIVTLAGTATRDAASYPFEASVTISDNRSKAVTDPAQPGLNPLCARRIIKVAPIVATVTANSSLLVRVDPRGWFNTIDFASLDRAQTDPPLYVIPDTDRALTIGAVAGRNLLTGILTGVLPSGDSAYSFSFQ